VAAAVEALAVRAQSPPLLLLFDFDGTLCEFTSRPDKTVLPARRRELLSLLAAHPALQLGIISGRRIEDVRRRAGVRGSLFYAGLHGLEIEGPNMTFRHARLADARDVLHAVRIASVPLIARFHGLLLEDKEHSLVLHSRMLGEADEADARQDFLTAADPFLRSHRLKIQPGNRMIELLPDVAWDKGDAVRLVRATLEKRARRVGVAFFGDDLTDEHAFVAVGDTGVTIVVGDRPSAAALRVANPLEIEHVLSRLADALGVAAAPA
jgi:trehalose-phosphatase